MVSSCSHVTRVTFDLVSPPPTLLLPCGAREWYSYHFPEMVKIVPDNHMYARVTSFIGDRASLTKDRLDELGEILMDTTKAEAIYDAAQFSMGEIYSRERAGFLCEGLLGRP